MTDIIYNSPSLRQRHPAIYQDIFARCFLVVSTPVKFFWGGEYGAYIGAPLIGQNLPLRVYVGLESIKGRGRVEINDQMYVPSKDRFLSQMDQVHRRKLIQYLIETATVLYRRPDFQSFRVHSLSESLPSSGLGMSGAFAAALSTALLTDSQRINHQNIENWAKVPTYELPLHRSFDRVHRLGWKIASLLHDGISSGGACFMSLVGSVYPILYYSEKRTGFLASPLDVRVPLNIKDNYNLVDRLFYGGIRLDELFGYKDQPSWPVEMYLIYSGDKGGGRAAKSFREIDDRLAKISDMVLKNFSFYKTNPSVINPIFHQICATEGWEGLHTNYLGTSATVTLEILYGLKQIFDFGGSERSIGELCDSINSFQSCLRVLGRSTQTIQHMVYHLHTDFKRRLDGADVGVKLTGGGRGGNLLVVTPAVEAQEILVQEIKIMTEELKQDLWLTYSSPRDGIEERGVVVEQNLSDSIFSSLVTKGSLVLEAYSGNQKNTLTLTSQEFEKKKRQMPMLIDGLASDIYLRGRLLTSKDIKSSKATVAILKLLLARLNEGLTKAELPHGSYTIDRNELQSKILTPLQKSIKKELRDVLPISIIGPIRQYELKLGTPRFDIYVLVKRV